MSLNLYLVGGAVRDELLDLPVRERDWVVVGATPEAMLKAGFRQADPEFPVFLHPETGEEYALARREHKSGAGYRGFRVDAAPDVTLEEDLARRDLTINAMARDADGHLIDPYGGEQDLHEGMLRHVTPAFVEDPVRLLRVARFAARFGAYGFRVAHSTHRLMCQMVSQGVIAELQAQRIWREMHLALDSAQPWRFFEVLHACGGLQELLPGLAVKMQRGHQVKAVDDGPLAALRAATQAGADPELRLAALLLSLPDELDALRQSLGLSHRVMEYARLARQLWFRVQQLGTMDGRELEDLLGAMRAWQQGHAFESLLTVFRAQPDAPQALAALIPAREAAGRVDVRALRDSGLEGADLGAAIRAARGKLIEKALTQWHLGRSTR